MYCMMSLRTPLHLRRWQMHFGPIGGASPQASHSVPQNIDENIQQQLGRKFSAEDHAGIQDRKENLLKTFDSLSENDAKALYDRLKSRNAGDETSRLFHDKLAGATRNQLLGILQKKFSARNELDLKDSSGPENAQKKGQSEGAKEKTGQIKLEGQLTQKVLHDRYETGKGPVGGGQNEIRLGDSGGGQGFGIKSSKDLNVVVEPDERDESEGVTVDITHSVVVDQKPRVSGEEYKRPVIEQHGPKESLEVVAAPGSPHSGAETPGGGGSNELKGLDGKEIKERPHRSPRAPIQTATTQGGASTNEVKMEDATGSEDIYINPSRDSGVSKK